MKKVFIIILSFQLSACSVYPQSNHLMGHLRLADRYQLERQRNLSIPFESNIYLPIVELVKAEKAIDREQYVQLVNQAAAAFRARFRRVEVGTVPESGKQAQASAQQLQCDYALIITPSDWHEGRDLPLFEESKGKTGIDKIRLAIKLVEVSSGELLDQIEIQAKSGYFTFLGDSPGELATAPLNHLARSLGAGRRAYVGLE